MGLNLGLDPDPDSTISPDPDSMDLAKNKYAHLRL
jgi:hypothetical protein